MSIRPGTDIILRDAGVRPTLRRGAIYDALAGTDTPKSAESIHRKVKSDLVTVYRTLETFVGAGLAREVRFKDDVVRYELAEKRHHHHLVCTSCDRIDELPYCDVAAIEKQALRASKNFVRVHEHALEFFGTCASCAKR